METCRLSDEGLAAISGTTHQLPVIEAKESLSWGFRKDESRHLNGCNGKGRRP